MFKTIIAGAAALALAVGLAPDRAQADGDIARGVIFGAIIGGGIAAIASQSRNHYDDRRVVRRRPLAPRYGVAPRYRPRVIVPRHRSVVIPRGIFSTRDRSFSNRRINRRVDRRVERRLDRRAERRAEIRSDRRAERRVERRFDNRRGRGSSARQDARISRALAERRRHIRDLRRSGQFPNGRADP